MEKGKSLLIFSSKGGVGKSTIAINLASSFSHASKKTLIIDCDFSSGSIATYLNKPYTKTVYNFVDDYQNNRYHEIGDYIEEVEDNLYIIPSCKDPRQGASILPSYIDILLEKATSSFDYVIIDSNHILDEFNVNLLDKADFTYLVLSNDLIDIKNTRSLVTIFKNIEKTNYKIILNNGLSLFKNYYGLYDIKTALKKTVDYVIDSDFYVKSFDQYVSDGKILFDHKRFPKSVKKCFASILDDLESKNE